MDTKSIDRDMLGELIRLKAHIVEVIMKCRDKSEETENSLSELQDYLDEWSSRGLALGPDKLWAQDVISLCKENQNDKHELIIQSLKENNSPSENIFDAIKTRRSIRFWKKQPVSHEILYKIIEAAVYAPSSFNRMPWKFYIVENDLENIIKGDASNKSMIEKAPVRIYIAVDERLYEEDNAAAMDAALCAQNILLAAHSSGLGACLIYQCELIDQDKLKADLGIPGYYNIICAVLLGYPDELANVPGRVDVEEVTSFIKFNSNIGTYLK